jgi:8-amino-7-oxononanoate synthase
MERLQKIFSSREIKPIVERCNSDTNTRLRLRYSPYYHLGSASDGVRIEVEGRAMIMMSSNEYLGLSRHPKVVEAAKRALDQWGTSSCGSRLANGSRTYHAELEEALAHFLGKEMCHVTSAGYLACVCSLSSLVQRGDILLVDPSVHSSIWDGAILSGAKIERFTHNDMDALAVVLDQLEAKQPKAIAVDGVYSMEGHIAALPRLCDLADQHRAALVVDDAHGFGILGRDGRGVCDHFGVTDRVDLIAGSFSKSLASTGGFVAGSKGLIEYLRSNSRQIIFSAAISPAAAAAADAALEVMQNEPQHRENLWNNYHYLRRIVDEIGLDYWRSPTPALPIVIGDKEKCYFLWKALWDAGFFTVMSIAPGVPLGKDLIRVAVTAAHTREQLERFGEALASASKRFGIRTTARAS